MTAPRCILPGTVYLLTRCAVRQHFVFHPCEQRRMQAIFFYHLAVTSQRHGIRVMAACLMSSHYHIVLEDVRGVLPKFVHDFGQSLADTTQPFRRWSGQVMEKGPASYVALPSLKAIVDECAYILANPTAAGAVRYSKDWPGARTRVADVGCGVVETSIPPFRRANKTWPEVATLQYQTPKCVSETMSADELQEAIDARVSELEREAWASHKRDGRGFQGAARACRVSTDKRGVSGEGEPSLNPRFAARDASVLRRAIEAWRKFRQAYDEALAAWRQGNTDVEFPCGTWKMRVLHHANCAPSVA
jgi:putative transposase